MAFFWSHRYGQYYIFTLFRFIVTACLKVQCKFWNICIFKCYFPGSVFDILDHNSYKPTTTYFLDIHSSPETVYYMTRPFMLYWPSYLHSPFHAHGLHHTAIFGQAAYGYCCCRIDGDRSCNSEKQLCSCHHKYGTTPSILKWNHSS